MTADPVIDRHPTLQLIGHTPLVETRLFRDRYPTARVFAKMEAFNPGGSIKDRPVARMLADAQARGDLRPGQTILDSSSGNAGICLRDDRVASGPRRRDRDARQREPGARAAHHGARRRYPLHRRHPGIRRGHARGPAAPPIRSGAVLLRRPIQQRLKLAGALRRHRQRNPLAGAAPT